MTWGGYLGGGDGRLRWRDPWQAGMVLLMAAVLVSLLTILCTTR